MTLQELNDWIKSTKHIETSIYLIDSCGNEDYYKIFKKDIKFYKIEYMNGHPYERWGDRGYIRGEYDINEVKRIEWVETLHDWEYISLDK